MARPYAVPIGYIERPTDEGATFILNNAEDSKSLRINTPATVWRYSPGQLALAKVRGLISAVGYVTATCGFSGGEPDMAPGQPGTRATPATPATPGTGGCLSFFIFPTKEGGSDLYEKKQTL